MLATLLLAAASAIGSTVASPVLVEGQSSSSWNPSQYSQSQARTLIQQKLTCCNALSFVFGNKISYPNTTVYDTSLASYWSLQEAEVHPSCVFKPTTTTDVSLAVFLLHVGGDLFPGHCDFAVRSGGHTPWAGAANIANGITIDMQNFKQVAVASDRQTVQIGTGNRWVNVYSVLDAMNLATSGGRVGIVGVGGLTTGGGISFFSPRYGFVCDNVVNFQVVIASGQLVDANATSNPDLWRALRGGSNNFGIVTTFTMRTFEQGKFWGGFIGFTIDTITQQFQAFQDLLGSANYDPYAALIYSVVYNVTGRNWYVASNFEYTKNQTYPPFFKEFTSLPQTFSTMRISNLTDFTLELAASNPIGFRQLFATGTYGNSAKQMAAIYSIANATVQPLNDVQGLKWSISYQPEPTVITSKAVANGGNSLGLSAASGNLFNVLLTATWDLASDDARVNAQVKSLFAQAATSAATLGVTNPYLYLNYAAPWQDPITGYGAANVGALKAASKKYDPEGVFQYQDINFDDGFIHNIGKLLLIPLSISETLITGNFTALAGAATKAGLVPTLEDLSDVTIFCPNNDAFQKIASGIANITNDHLIDISEYHVVQGSVGYSTLLSNSSLATLKGEDVKITIDNDGAVLVKAARVINAEILVANGVIHVIDEVLKPVDSNARPDESSSTAATPTSSLAMFVPFTSGIIPQTSVWSELTATTSFIAVGLVTAVPSVAGGESSSLSMTTSRGVQSAKSGGSGNTSMTTSGSVAIQTTNASGRVGLPALTAVLVMVAAYAMVL
ncbi:hypothetical protein LTR62_003488 [Meristemomyces frigidus]|uniref:FAS1 domain-containing protein n=1 Tax=Meristemomyces frigidus TaxID=1508187 RepID=A0AAN7TG66_9PEZI|nr:hypothetical protein LTR62_003488 [Meristemomyces frigidus]